MLLTEQEWRELQDEFEADLDEHMGEWEDSLRKQFGLSKDDDGEPNQQ